MAEALNFFSATISILCILSRKSYVWTLSCFWAIQSEIIYCLSVGPGKILDYASLYILKLLFTNN